MIDIKLVESAIEGVEAIRHSLNLSTQLQQASWQTISTLKDLVLHYQTCEMQRQHPNPLNKFGKKCFSQADEDGITLEIIRRINIKKGVYAEFGVGDGLENNTLILAAAGWRGFWVGGQDLAFRHEGASRFSYIKDWITLENVSDLAQAGLREIKEQGIDVFSLDLDGNDIYFVDKLLKSGLAPKLFIVEYNAKFPPPTRFQINYDPTHQWRGDDYFGAALMNFAEMFSQHEFKLICCNSHSGANAFFVHSKFEHLFSDVPDNIEDIYVPPRYHLYTSFGHKQSIKVVENIINQL
jgi:hypothetical protein